MNELERFLEDVGRETDRVWNDEPYEITLIRNNVSMTGAGSEGQYFSILVHLESFMMLLGPHAMYRILLLSRDEAFGTYELRQSMIGVLKRPFDQFEFLGDLGLISVHRLGKRFLAVLEDADRDEFVAASSAFLTYFNRMYQWIHLVFPWYLGDQFPKEEPVGNPKVEKAAESWRRDNPDHDQF